jgi:deoxyribonuclease V
VKRMVRVMGVNVAGLNRILSAIAGQVRTDDAIGELKYAAGFDLAYFGNKAACAGVVIDVRTMSVVEQKYVIAKPGIQYIPGLLAFRAGPAVLQAYYSLEYEPDVLIVNGHGIAHPLRAGLASYVGVELGRPCIGVAKSLLVGKNRNNEIIIDGEVRGLLVRTKEHARPLVVSPGHLVSASTAAEIVKKLMIYPHKLPEPLHLAHRLAAQLAKET